MLKLVSRDLGLGLFLQVNQFWKPINNVIKEIVEEKTHIYFRVDIQTQNQYNRAQIPNRKGGGPNPKKHSEWIKHEKMKRGMENSTDAKLYDERHNLFSG